MRLLSFTSVSLLPLVLLAPLVASVFLNVPDLYSCAPADIRVLAKSNYTIEGRDQASHKLVFRAHVSKGVNRVTWDAVDLPANATAVITVTDQIGPSQSSTAAATASALVLANPTGNTTCLAKSDQDKDNGHKATRKEKNLVPTVIGIAVGAFVFLMLLLVGGMMWRRKKEKGQKIEQESVDLNHSGYGGGQVPAGSSYMARLVPGLKLQDARPLPRDRALESEQAQYASTRRGTQYYKYGVNPNASQDNFELGRRDGLPAGPVGPGGVYPTQHQSGAYYQNQPWSPPQQQQQQQQQGYNDQTRDPFASQADLSRGSDREVYGQKDWDQSQTSFLTKKSSR